MLKIPLMVLTTAELTNRVMRFLLASVVSKDTLTYRTAAQVRMVDGRARFGS